jgi:hypothetical protein
MAISSKMGSEFFYYYPADISSLFLNICTIFQPTAISKNLQKYLTEIRFSKDRSVIFFLKTKFLFDVELIQHKYYFF